MKYKRQHTIPQSYLRAWVDKGTPDNYVPYVWVISRGKTEPIKKSPSNLFVESDFYTNVDEDGERDVRTEKILSVVESRFSRVRRENIENRRPIDKNDKSILCSFTAVMHARTKARAEHTSDQWKKVLDLGKRMQDRMETASDEEKKSMASILHSGGSSSNSFTLEEVENIVDNPIQSFMAREIIVTSDYLQVIPMAILTTSDPIGFITSDAPCVCFDPALLEDQPPFGAGGFISPSLEVTLPLSPSSCLYFSRGFINDCVYLDVDNAILGQMNLRTKLYCRESIILNQEVNDPSWFDTKST